MTKKIAISLPDGSLSKARAAVKAGKAASLSGYIAQLVENANAHETFDEMISAWMKESGASKAELRAAEEESRLAFERAGLTRKGRYRAKAQRKAS
jgi:Arc/MetJ-type ribon-helix-helix transcriptional regulator